MKKDSDVYVIAVNGFVPGLPARLTMLEAKEMGVEALLQEAIRNKNYVVERPSARENTPHVDGEEKE